MVLEALAILALLWWVSDLVARRRYGIGARQRYLVIRQRRRRLGKPGPVRSSRASSRRSSASQRIDR